MAATGKGSTLTEGLELVIGPHRVIIDSIDCPAKRVKVRTLSTEHVQVRKTPEQDKKPCNAT
jgi:hypothetical protein